MLFCLDKFYANPGVPNKIPHVQILRNVDNMVSKGSLQLMKFT